MTAAHFAAPARARFLLVHRTIDKMMGLTLADLRNAGAVLVDVELDMPPELSDAKLLVFTAEMKVALPIAQVKPERVDR